MVDRLISRLRLSVRLPASKLILTIEPEEKSWRPEAAPPKGVLCVKAVKLVGVPVGTVPRTHEEGIFETGVPPDSAAVELLKYP